MKVTTDENFIYFSLFGSKERGILIDKFSAVKTKQGYRVAKNLWSIRELYSEFPDLRDDLAVIGASQKEEVNYLTRVRKASELVQVQQTDRHNKSLRGYQNSDIYYLKHLLSAGVFNEQRTGKTPTVIHLLKDLLNPLDQAIVVCPASLIYNWQREFEKWTPDVKTTVIAGTKSKREKGYVKFQSGVMIVSKDILKQDIDMVSEFDFTIAVIDEAHFLRNYKTTQSKALFKLKAERRYALTGTPTVKHPADIYGILHFLYPKKFPSYWQFVERYFNIENNFMGYKEVLSEKKHRIEELQNIIGILSVQRKRRDIMQWLPDKERTTFYCEMDSKQRKAYQEMLEYFFVEETEVDASSVLTQLIRLRQICLDPSLLGIDAASAKTDTLVEWLTESLPKGEGEGVVIMSMFTSYLKKLNDLLTEKGFRVGFIHGELDSKVKQFNATLFQEGKLDILLCNIVSAGTGFTLDRAETIIFTDKAWNPAENEQAEDRITPTTPDKVHKHTIISFVCQNSVDEKINELLERKKSLTDLINEGGLEAIKKLLR
ncbi:HepA Superfamily II DNA/RNA helicases, SNF2 family [uncultured Caudovirales phage]|uniref:HepA Superfamily II DNA/RNA helicases, SNF2 family n=1 Tax=uncultured Caudovirales phage TaxID=2100421 RepID=A0A6J5MC61_9CAUD|nr:HepA Superfamily II DNA/RNA helicases, SNF2 family [uncultured Caudovirales phage]